MILVLRSATFALLWMIKKTMEQQVDFTYNEFLYQNGQTNKLQSNIKYPGYRLKKDFKNVTHNIKALKDVYWKRPILCQNTLRMCAVLVELVFYRTYWRAPQIVKSCHPGWENSIWSKLGEPGGHRKHGKHGKHQPDDLKHSICDSKHSFCQRDDSKQSIWRHL